MEKLNKKQFQEHLRKNCGDYNSMVSISILYFALYGEYPKIGCSGQQRDYSISMEGTLPEIEKGVEQIEILANFIMAEIEGEPSRSEGAGDTAIRIMKDLRAEIKKLKVEIA